MVGQAAGSSPAPAARHVSAVAPTRAEDLAAQGGAGLDGGFPLPGAKPGVGGLVLEGRATAFASPLAAGRDVEPAPIAKVEEAGMALADRLAA
jgi:hypothetical protein